LPPCPHCKRHGWEAFHQAYKYPPDCRNCGKTFESGTFRVNTESRRDETAYWYEY
jgi:ribosomal protein L37AE/L43A